MQIEVSDPLFLITVGAAVLDIVFLVLYLQARSKLRAFKPISDLESESRRLVEANQALERRRDQIDYEIKSTQDKYQVAEQQSLSDLDRTREKATEETKVIQAQLEALRAEVIPLEQQMEFVEHGLYEPMYDFDNSQRYAIELESVREQQKAAIREKSAVKFYTEWTVEGSRAKGKKMENEYSKLMLRAFNGESDALIIRVRYNNIHNIEKRMTAMLEAVNKLGQTNRCEITYDYYRLKIAELNLVHGYQEMKQAEAEEQRQIREQMREEEKAMREIERAIIEAEREEARYEKALEKARFEAEQATGAKHARLEGEIERLQALIEEAHQNRERAKSRAEMTRSGHVYVISNVGSFGEDVYKIGMTRRLDPMERVAELGDASVPFTFDVHAMIFAEDAPRLENALHRAFDSKRVNRINLRKEFFRVKLENIQKVAIEHKADVQFTLLAEAKDYKQSQAAYFNQHKPVTVIRA